MQAGYVHANGIRIYYHRTGGNRPAMVLAHGFSDSGLCWMGLIPALQDGYDVIMPDARGHGLSDAPETGYTTQDRVEDLVGMIRALELEKPILMGHSMGASTVGWTVANYPDLARAAILEDPGLHRRPQPTLSPQELAAQVEQRRSDILKRRTMPYQELIELVRTEIHPGWRDVEYSPWADSKQQLSPNVVQAFRGVEHVWLGDAFARIQIPVLVLKQDTDEAGKQQDQSVVSLIPKGQLVHVPGAGHNIRRDRYDETVVILKRFLSDLSSGSD